MPSQSQTPPATGAGSYEDYRQTHDYQHDLGVIPLPLAQREAGFRLIRLHGGMGLRKVKWTAVKEGTPPRIPTATNTGYDTLVESSVVAHLPRVNLQTGTYTFTLTGEYLYVQNAPRQAGVHALPTAAYPFPVELADKRAAALAPRTIAGINQIGGSSDNPINAIANAAVDEMYGPGQYPAWPFTFIPAQFAATTIVG